LKIFEPLFFQKINVSKAKKKKKLEERRPFQHGKDCYLISISTSSKIFQRSRHRLSPHFLGENLATKTRKEKILMVSI
jgi:hypothetical protein